MLNADNLTVSIPYYGCDKNCPYCISRMTGEVKLDGAGMLDNFDLALAYAIHAGVRSVLFTGKGEPLVSWTTIDYLKSFAGRIKNKLPMEIQTNGLNLSRSTDVLRELLNIGINVVAISIDSEEILHDEKYQLLFRDLAKAKLVGRITVNINRKLGGYLSFRNLLDYCKEFDIRQITVRKLTVPFGAEDSKEAEWIKTNADPAWYSFKRGIEYETFERGRRIRKLLSGMTVWDIDGISFIESNYCIQEESNDNDIRSLIYLPDGHLYTSWNSRASILF